MKRDIYIVITDYLKGTIKDEDFNFLLNWVNESDNNKALFEQIEDIWRITGLLKNNLKIDIQKEWNIFMHFKNLSSKN